MVMDILRNMNMFVDGQGYAGRVDEVIPPKLTIKTEEFRAGGMDGPIEIDQGMEKMETTLTASGVDLTLLQRWGLMQGEALPVTLRGALRSEDGTVRAVVINLRGRIKEVDWGTWKPGEKVPLKAMMAVTYYKCTLDGEVVHEVDMANMIRIVNGVDQLAQVRTALGME